MNKEKIINDYIESNEMREYLIKNIGILRAWQFVDIICGARKPLEKKYEDLKRLAGNTKDEYIISALAKAEDAINNLNLNSGEIFLINERGFDIDISEEKFYGSQPVSSLNQACKVIEEDWKYCTQKENSERTDWYELEKYIPDKNGDLKETVSYMIAPNNEIWFYAGERKFPYNTCLYSSADLNLPVPFSVGDIITIDCRPFAPVRQGVIIETWDNLDCCSVQCAYVSKSSGIITGAVKHSSIFFDLDVHIRISALYRAEKYMGELAEGQKILKDISNYVKDDEKKGQDLWNFIYKNDNNKTGVPQEKILEYMKGVIM